MSRNELGKQSTGRASLAQDGRKRPSLQAPVPAAVYGEVEEAMVAEGIANVAEAVRLVMTTWARSRAVRQSVRKHVHLAVLPSRRTTALPRAG